MIYLYTHFILYGTDTGGGGGTREAAGNARGNGRQRRNGATTQPCNALMLSFK